MAASEVAVGRAPRLAATLSAAGAATRVAVCGNFGRANYGNEAILSAFLARLDRAVYAPVVMCEEPEQAARMHRVPARGLGGAAHATSSGRLGRIGRLAGTARNRLRVLLGSVRAARDVDAVVIAGSGGLERYGSGAFGFPFDIWALAVGAKLARKPFLIVDVGTELLPSRMGRFFARSAARAAAYRSFRDAASRDALVGMGASIAAEDPVVSDPVFGLQLARPAVRAHGVVVLGIMAYRSRDAYVTPSPKPRHDYLERCGRLVTLLQAAGHEVRIACGDDSDIEAARELAAGLDRPVRVLEARSPAELLAELTGVDAVVASRYHTVVLSLLGGTPVVPIGYSGKHDAILRGLGLPETHFDIEGFEPAEVAAAIEQQISRRPELTGMIDAAVAAARARLDAEWPVIEAIIRRGSTGT